MRYRLFFPLCAFCLFALQLTAAAQQHDSTVAMNYTLAKNSGTNTSPANINMFPNPATGVVYIYLNTLQPGHVGQCILYNEQGVPCAMQNISNGNNAISLALLPSGIYTIRILLHEGMPVTKKLVIGPPR